MLRATQHFFFLFALIDINLDIVVVMESWNLDA